MKRLALLLVALSLLSACAETDSLSSSMYGEYILMKSEFVGSTMSTDTVSGILVLTSNSIELYLDFDSQADVISLQSVAHYGHSASGRKTITAVKTGLVLEYYRSEGMLVTTIKDEDAFFKLYWQMEVPY